MRQRMVLLQKKSISKNKSSKKVRRPKRIRMIIKKIRMHLMRRFHFPAARRRSEVMDDENPEVFLPGFFVDGTYG